MPAPEDVTGYIKILETETQRSKYDAVPVCDRKRKCLRCLDISENGNVTEMIG